MATGPEGWQKWSRIVAKAWADEDFKKRLLADPVTVLNENGVAVLPGLKVFVSENTDDEIHLTLPPRPDESELSEEDLASVAGGAKGVDSFNCVCMCYCSPCVCCSIK